MPFVEEGRRRLLTNERFGDGDQLGAGLADDVAGGEVVGDVAGEATEIPDDDEVHPRRLLLVAALQLVQHLQEAEALVQVDVGRVPGVGELRDNTGVEFDSLLRGPNALRVDRQTVVAVVGLRLVVRRDADVREGSRQSWPSLAADRRRQRFAL
jgi:hypothetical protein